MHHVVVSQWSRQSGPLHRWDARLKFLALLIFLAALGLQRSPPRVAILALPLLVALALSRLPAGGLLLRAAFVLPLSATFALVAWLMGEPARAALLLAKSFLSALAAVLLIATTPMPQLMSALDALGLPRVLVLTIQMVYRYLFVIFAKAQHMRQATLGRTGAYPQRRLLLRAGGGLMAVLFGGAHQQAEGIHQAMLARGFNGRLPLLAPGRIRAMDWYLLAASVALSLGLPVVL